MTESVCAEVAGPRLKCRALRFEPTAATGRIRFGAVTSRAMRIRSFVLGVLLAAAPASAAQVELEFGAHYWVSSAGVFALKLGVQQRLARHFELGVRAGGLLTAPGPVVGVPLDVALTVPVSHVYFELTGGPWFTFTGTDVVHGHVAFGFGTRFRRFQIGGEFGYLSPRAIVGLRLAVFFG